MADLKIAGSLYTYGGQELYLTVANSLFPVQIAAANIIGGGAVLPPQTGNGGKFLTTDGIGASWQALDGGTY